jgi:hypothetical protein
MKIKDINDALAAIEMLPETMSQGSLANSSGKIGRNKNPTHRTAIGVAIRKSKAFALSKERMSMAMKARWVDPVARATLLASNRRRGPPVHLVAKYREALRDVAKGVSKRSAALTRGIDVQRLYMYCRGVRLEELK